MTLSVDVTVHVVTDGERVKVRDKMVSVLVNDLIKVIKRRYLSITNDVNLYAGALR